MSYTAPATNPAVERDAINHENQIAVLVSLTNMIKGWLQQQAIPLDIFSIQVVPTILHALHRTIRGIATDLDRQEELIIALGSRMEPYADRPITDMDEQTIRKILGNVEDKLEKLEEDFGYMQQLKRAVDGCIRIGGEAVVSMEHLADWEDAGRYFDDLTETRDERIAILRELCIRLREIFLARLAET